MPDQTDTPGPDEDGNPGTGGPRGFMVYIAIALIAILVFLIFFGNTLGPGASSTVITENTWSLRSFSDPDGTIIPVLNGTTISAKFSPNGTLTGSGGCNSYSARYMVRDTLIVVSRVTATSLACLDDNPTLQEMRYYVSIEDAAFFRVNGRVLTLYGTDGKPLLVFSPAQPGN
jgi:heat shock protein HslJ